MNQKTISHNGIEYLIQSSDPNEINEMEKNLKKSKIKKVTQKKTKMHIEVKELSNLDIKKIISYGGLRSFLKQLKVKVCVIHTNEELMIAQEVYHLISKRWK